MSTHTVLITIPHCSATHVLGETTVPLSEGTLSLIKYASPMVAPAAPATIELKAPLDDASLQKESKKAVLTMQIGKLAFPLMKDTLFGTDANSARSYMFVPELGPAGQASQGGYVLVKLPDQAQQKEDENDSPLETFEKVLISEGLLKDGWEATRDDITQGLKNTTQGLKGTISMIRDKVAQGLSTESGRTPPEAIEGNGVYTI